jgi:DNA-binding CsgD family transcriptional regulator
VARKSADRIDRWGGRRAALNEQLYARYLRSLTAQANGDFDEAFRQLCVLAAPATFALNTPLAVCASFDFVDCAVRTGRRSDAVTYVARLATVETTALSPRVAMLTRCAAALASPFEVSLFQESVSVPGIESWPFDAARVKLALAEGLRRKRAATQARTYLTQACATFEELGAKPWLDRATRELRALGVGAAPTDTTGQALTPQEREVAELAAAGYTNKEIAKQIYMSHRTVGAHLYRIFPKLGITTRAALRDALVDVPR